MRHPNTLPRSGDLLGVYVAMTGSIRPGAATICRMTDLETALIRAIKAKMGGLSVTQAAMIKATGIPGRTLRNYLSGRSVLRMNHVAVIAPVLGMTPGGLVEYARTEWMRDESTGRDIGDADRAEVMGVINEVTGQGERNDPSRAGDQGA